MLAYHPCVVGWDHVAVTDELKLYCIVSREAWAVCKHVPGKMAAQCGHAFVGAILDAQTRFPTRAAEYVNSVSCPKITLIADEAQLHELNQLYKDKFGTALIKDAGRTVFPRPTLTALGIGPILASEREEILRNMRVW